ncbi:hypothetical protein PHYSODRAFT_325222 [Phytophthora sojae]|uniref:Peptidase A2 domain-containing protein n=1 Tax=Phytophthora sojae (strain P6497) TaxID=1094619 RepID=G4YRM9_PHYSP|nr:hypothetical protein PHYSODRAFT_325222 [Phytophthora sojae]EGZ24070.1 hypothetical protein PHYSODRAFT_325222 [Phytophthora sojae]|eukprot:XP_009519358.1 hypothetical protein PHYSODRAFT_325222 [Phytophthora sojae]
MSTRGHPCELPSQLPRLNPSIALDPALEGIYLRSRGAILEDSRRQQRQGKQTDRVRTLPRQRGRRQIEELALAYQCAKVSAAKEQEHYERLAAAKASEVRRLDQLRVREEAREEIAISDADARKLRRVAGYGKKKPRLSEADYRLILELAGSEPQRKAALRLGTTQSTVSLHLRKQGTHSERRGRNPMLTEEMIFAAARFQFVSKTASFAHTVAFIQMVYGIKPAKATVSKHLMKVAGFRLGDFRRLPRDRNSQRAIDERHRISKRRAWSIASWIPTVADEFYSEHPDHISLLLAASPAFRVLHFEIVEGSVLADVVCGFMKEMVAAYLRKFPAARRAGTRAFIMDNASMHHRSSVTDYLNGDAVANLLKIEFVLIYSPFLNPLDEVFGTVKSRLWRNRSEAGVTDESKAMLKRCLAEVLMQVTEHDVRQFYFHVDVVSENGDYRSDCPSPKNQGTIKDQSSARWKSYPNEQRGEEKRRRRRVKMAKGVKSAVPATPVKLSGTRNEASILSGSSFSAPATDLMESIDERSVSYDTAIDSSDAKEDDEAMNGIGGSRSITRDLSETFNDMPGPEPACDGDDGATEGFKASVTVGGATSKPVGTRPSLNGDTPAANKVLGRCLELMKTKSEWMQLFSPKQVYQAIWMDHGGALATPINSTSTRQVAQNTVDLLRGMGCEPQILPADAALTSWTPTTGAMALTKWRKKLREAFGVVDGGSTKLRSASEAVDPSKVPLPATPRKAATDDGVFAAKGEASPYMQDSHMVAPRSTDRSERLARETESSYGTPGTRGATGRWSSRRYDLRDDSSDSDDDLGSDCYEGDLPSEWARQARELSAPDDQSSTPKLEITRPNTPCGGFLPRKTSRTWKLLCEAFIKYCCSKFSQSAKAWYYSAKRESKDHVCDYLNRLNGYTRNAGVQFEHGDCDAKDHVKHFLVTCNDRDLEERLCPFGQDDGRHRDARSNEDSRSGYRRERHYRDEDRHERRYRDDDRRRDRRDGSPHRSRVTLIDALADVMAELNVGASVGARNEAPYAPPDVMLKRTRITSRMSANTRTTKTLITTRMGIPDMSLPLTMPSAGPQPKERSLGLITDASGTEEARPTVNEMVDASMGRVHDAGKCEALHELTKFLKSKADKKDLSPELQSLDPPTETGLVPIGLPQLAEPAVDADYLFAFTGESKRSDDLKNNERVKPTENGENRDASLVEIDIDEDDDDERDGHPTEPLITSLAQIRGPPRSLVRAVKLLPGERLWWWSSQRYDKRKRMRALANGAVDDARTRILLDTGANVSVVSASFAKRLRVREVRNHGRSLEVRNHGRSLEVRGINPGVMETRRRTLVKITLGWEQVYEFEMWIMDHSAGVDVVLGMDFIIPAGIRLDLFHGTARLPDDVMVSLLQSQSVEDDEPYGTQLSCGSTEDLYVPGREWREFRLPRQRLPRSKYDV